MLSLPTASVVVTALASASLALAGSVASVSSAHSRAAADASAVDAAAAAAPACRCMPSQSCWPKPADWAALNRTVQGRLVATVPIAAPCHRSKLAAYDAEACEAIRSTWWFPETHLDTSSSPMAPFYANDSCDPFTAPDDRCELGAYPRYAVRAASVADYQATLRFASERNIRLVVRNTGHDYFGKSTGAGALALWTHFLKDTAVVDYRSTAYTGKALKMGAGVEVREAYRAAGAAGLAVVGGACETVGVAGGFSQGGGHGPLMSRFGLGADQVLEWEVVTAEGKHLVASPTKNKDLYWALSGGGGGTYAAVVSVTVRAHRLTKVSAARLSFFTSANVTEPTFQKAVKAFLLLLPRLTESGTWSSWLLGPGFFILSPVVAPDVSRAKLQSLLDPLLGTLTQSNIAYDYDIQEFGSFFSAWEVMFPPNNITEFNIGGRLLPKQLLQTSKSADSVLKALAEINAQGAIISGSSFDVSKFPNNVQNSVNPAWRSAVTNFVIGLPYDSSNFKANIALQEQMTNVIMPKLEALTPGGGAYLNEADPNQADWQKLFYGCEYAKLDAIKRKYDPRDLFYGLTAVGSDRWEVAQDGALCRVS